MAKINHRIGLVIRSIASVTSKISMVVLSLMILLVGADVIGRYVFNNAIKGVLDIVETSLIFIVFLSVGDVAVKKAHITVDAITSRLSADVRTKLNCVTSLASLVIVALLTWQLGVRGWHQLVNPTLYTASLEMPIAPFLLVAALGCLILTLVLVVDSVNYISQAWRGKPKR